MDHLKEKLRGPTINMIIQTFELSVTRPLVNFNRESFDEIFFTLAIGNNNNNNNNNNNKCETRK